MSEFKAKNINGGFQDGAYYIKMLIDPNDMALASMSIQELKNKGKLQVKLSLYDDIKHTDSQRKLFWKIVDKLSVYINGSKRTEDRMLIYRDLLIQCGVKYQEVRMSNEVFEFCQRNFKAAIRQPSTKREDGTFNAWLFEGSSKYSLKEYNELLETAWNYVDEVGLFDSELEAIRRT